MAIVKKKRRLKGLLIQLQPDRVPDFDLDSSLKAIVSLSPTAKKKVTRGNGYIDVYIQSPKRASLWAKLCELISNDKGLRRASIITCEGESGWDDYLLLFHFDRRVKTDDISLRSYWRGGNTDKRKRA